MIHIWERCELAALFDLDRVESVRTELPSLANRRLPDQADVKVQVSPVASGR